MIRDLCQLASPFFTMTIEMWHVICDTWHMTHGGGVNILSSNFSSLALTVWDRQCLLSHFFCEKWWSYLVEVMFHRGLPCLVFKVIQGQIQPFFIFLFLIWENISKVLFFLSSSWMSRKMCKLSVRISFFTLHSALIHLIHLILNSLLLNT